MKYEWMREDVAFFLMGQQKDSSCLRTPWKHLTTLFDLCTEDKTPDVTQSVLIQEEFCT